MLWDRKVRFQMTRLPIRYNIKKLVSHTLTMKILHVESSSIFFPVNASRYRTSLNPLALAWVTTLKTCRIKGNNLHKLATSIVKKTWWIICWHSLASLLCAHALLLPYLTAPITMWFFINSILGVTLFHYLSTERHQFLHWWLQPIIPSVNSSTFFKNLILEVFLDIPYQRLYTTSSA